MENRGKSGSKRRTTRQSRRGTSMDSFIFHPARLSLYHSFSTDSETISSFCFDPNPYPSSNSSILSGLLNQEDGLIAPNSSSQTLSFGSGTSFPHPPAWIVEDLSSQAGSHIVHIYCRIYKLAWSSGKPFGSPESSNPFTCFARSWSGVSLGSLHRGECNEGIHCIL